MHLRPFIFISIPRCASSTVHYMLGLKGPKDYSNAGDAGIMDNHAPCAKILERYGPAEFQRRFKFAFVRNPWDRCISWFLHHRALSPYNSLEFRQWVKSGMPHHWKVQNETVYGDGRTPLEQHPFIMDERGKLLVDFVGRVERFEADIATVARAIGWDLPRQMPRINRSKAREAVDYRGYYDDAAALCVAERLAQDVSLFGYEF